MLISSKDKLIDTLRDTILPDIEVWQHTLPGHQLVKSRCYIKLTIASALGKTILEINFVVFYLWMWLSEEVLAGIITLACNQSWGEMLKDEDG